MSNGPFETVGTLDSIDWAPEEGTGDDYATVTFRVSTNSVWVSGDYRIALESSAVTR